MDGYMIISIVIIVAVIAFLIGSVRLYQRRRVKTGYRAGKFYRLGQHTGAFAGNYQMNKLGVEDNAEGRTDTEEEMYLFSDGDQKVNVD